MRYAAGVRLLLLTLPGPVLGQEPRPAATPCDGTRVSTITIVPRDPSFLRFPRALRALARGVGLHHTTTTADVIRRFLLLDVGQPCTERRVEESERILRFQPFLAGATVRALPDGAGGARIEVETIDEIPTIFDIRLRNERPAALRIGNGNVAGQGMSLAVRGERGFGYRDGVGARLVVHQAFGGPYTLALVADRTPLGSTLGAALRHPFITDLQRTAWYVGFHDVHAYTSFVRPDSVALALEARRRFAAVGGVLRIGARGRSAFVGGLLTHERVAPGATAVVISDSGLVVRRGTPLDGPFAPIHNVRVNAVLGVRSIRVVAARGFDALQATQDVATGVQVGAVVGRGVAWFDARDDDVFVAADLYAGLGSSTSFAALQIEAEARRDRDPQRWDAMVASGRVAWYVKPSPASLLIAGGELSGVWRARLPFQLRLGAGDGGVRGYRASRVAGAIRTVARLETRWVLGGLTRHVALGLASFADAGRVWAGGAPFGVDSRLKASVGVALLAAVPPRSRRLWRLDVAVPLGADAHARWEVRLTATRASGFWREPSDVARARAGAAPATIFAWP